MLIFLKALVDCSKLLHCSCCRVVHFRLHLEFDAKLIVGANSIERIGCGSDK